MKRQEFFILIIIALAAYASAARAQSLRTPEDIPLVTDLNAHLIAINSNFTGTDLLLFGTVNVAGDIVVIVRGPEGPVTIRRKDRVAGIWLNRESLTFEDAPGFYALAANRPWTEIVSPSLAARLEIGLNNLRLEPQDFATIEEQEEFRAALVRSRLAEGLYQENSGVISYLGPRLFRTRIAFPAIVPVGIYRAEVYLIQDGRVLAAQATPLFVNKQGIEYTAFTFAHERPFAYGLLTLLLSVLIGWAGAALFRRT